jgi:hypothetical protein
MQVVINQETKEIICLNLGSGIARISACLKKAMFISILRPIVDKIMAIKGEKMITLIARLLKSNLKMEIFIFDKKTTIELWPRTQ